MKSFLTNSLSLPFFNLEAHINFRNMPRTYSPNKFHSRYHKMGDHPLFHNGSTAKMFPAISELPSDRISDLYNVKPVNKQEEYEQETLFHEPLTQVAANYTFRDVDSPVRDQMRQKIGAHHMASTPNSSPFGSPLSIKGRVGDTTNRTTHVSGSSRPGTANSSIPRPPPFLSGGNPKLARDQISSKDRTTSMFIGFDVDEGIKQDKLHRQYDSQYQQMKICCLTPSVLREVKGSFSRPGTGGSGFSQSPSSPNYSGSPRSQNGGGRPGTASESGNYRSAGSGRLGSRGGGSINGTAPRQNGGLSEDEVLSSLHSSFRPFSRGTVPGAQESLERKCYLNSGDNDTAWSIRSLESHRIKNSRL